MSTSTTLTPQQIVSWAFGGTAIALTCGRYLIRWRVIGRLYWDDLAHLAAVIFMIAELALYNEFIKVDDVMSAWLDGDGPEKSDILIADEAMSVAIHVLFYCTIWSVKLAFLFFYRMLFNISKNFNIAWYSVLAYNIITFWVCMAGVFIQCDGNAANLVNYNICESEASLPWALKTYIFTYAAVVSSDLATMILPLAMLRGLKIPKTQKLAIALLFSLSLIAVFFDTLRLAKSFLGGTSLNILWYQLEETWVVILSATPSFYSLINWKKILERRTTGLRYDAYGDGSQRGWHYANNHSCLPSDRGNHQKGIIKTYEIEMDVGRRV